MVQTSLNLKPSLHHEHVKNGGSDLRKKKMKKSGSIKRPEFDTLRTPNSRRHVKQPGKPPPETTPNYMKPTTSSDARKEKPQVSPKTPQTSPHSSSLRRKSTKSKTFARTTSLKLTSTPSFKPARVVPKKCSPVALCENLDAQRATCSSTLKDCKFPTYLPLSPGGTELEGTSSMKVCPYTYCSLNGHRHAPLPPLKSFLSAKRRVIKNQRSVKIGCLSPRRANQLDLTSPTVSPLVQDELKNDFFLEIYAPKEELTETPAENQEEILDPAEEAYEIDSEASDMDCEKDLESAIYHDEDYNTPVTTEKETDPGGGKLEFLVHLDHEIDSCFDELLADQVSQKSFDEDNFGSDSSSSSDNFESIALYDYDETLSSADTSVTMIDPVGEEEEDKEDLFIEGSQSSKSDPPTLNTNEEEIVDTITSDDVPYQTSADDHSSEQDDSEKQCNEDKNFKTMSLIVQDKESDSAKPESELCHNPLSRAMLRCKNKKPIEDTDDFGKFNPRDPNFLPLQPDPEAENVDLRHQELDERKNAEEWMVDFALRQVVTKLGSDRKRKVALLVEAFEKVLPVSKFEFHLKHSSAFESPRPIQACS